MSLPERKGACGTDSTDVVCANAVDAGTLLGLSLKGTASRNKS